MLKFLLIIPAIFLFLSNIPFIQERSMKSMLSTMDKEDCCMKNGNMEGVCHKPPTDKQQSKKEGCSTDEDCSQPKTETTCICICCFQFFAPEQNFVRFDNKLFSHPTIHTGLIDQDWKDPFLSAPWQPPDIS